ncbi:MFS transporter [Nonomuraea gerenzanensis]|uniref:Putative integral membrane transport protein n=1 Tax=Nonomuraea gerenzanensis TaxID=93944 RepID=A0A1M4EDP2_9ACTN|nr:MFS transporter [Nonomuraea gerenzanensis]UBU08736.1 MFS transporter [Nonomuraea gerenzanensis]SBO97101.1 putative integral membrane transport protein [Nonomuraea gerenzanensis]
MREVNVPIRGLRAERLPRTVWWLVLARAINRLGAFSVGFLTVLITAEFGVSAVAAGVVAAAFGLATIPSRLLGGVLADRLGRRRTIVAGLVGCALAQAGIAVSGSVAMVAGFAVLLGLAFEVYEPPSQAMIADAVRPAQQAQAFSLFNTALAVGGMGAGLIAAGLGRWDLRWLFVADAVSCLLCAVVIRLVLPADRPAPVPVPAPDASPGASPGSAPDASSGFGHGSGSGSGGPSRGTWAAWRDRRLLVLLLSGTLFAVIFMQVGMAMPLALARRGMEAADAGLLSAVAAVVMVLCQPLLRWTAALSHHAAMTWGYLLLATGLAGYAASGGLPGHLAATLVWSAGDVLMFGRSYALVVDLAPPDARGRYLSVFGTCWGFATVLAPLSGTQLLDRAGPEGLWGGLAAACLLLAVAQHTVIRPLLDRQAPAL